MSEQLFMSCFLKLFLLATLLLCSTQFAIAQQDPEKVPQNSQPAENKAGEPEKKADVQIKEWIGQLASDKKEQVDAAVQSLLKNKEEALPVLLTSLENPEKKIRWYCLDILSNYSASQITPTLISRLSQETDPALLRKMLGILSSMKAKDAIASVVALLEHANPEVQAEAIWTLRTLDDAELPSRLLAMLKKTPAPVVKVAIFSAMAATGSKDAMASAVETMPDQTRQEESAEVLMAVADCAYALGNELGQNVLADIASGSSQAQVRRHALHYLLPMIHSENAGLLVEMLWDDELENRQLAYRKLLETTLESFDYDPNGKPLDRAASIEVWEKWRKIQKSLAMFATSDEKKREEISKEIIAQGELAVPYIVEYYQKASTDKVEILNLIANFNTPESVELLSASVKEGGKIAEASFEGLMKLHAKKHSEAIQKVLKTAFPTVEGAYKSELAGYLASLGDKEAIEFVQNLFKTDAGAALAIVKKYKIGQPEILNVLSAYFQGQDAEKKEKAFATLLEVKGWDNLISSFASLTEAQKLTLIESVNQDYKSGVAKLVPLIAVEKQEAVCLKLFEILAGVPQGQEEMYKLLASDISLSLVKGMISALEKQNAIPLATISGIIPNKNNPEIQLALIQSLPVSEDEKFQKFMSDVFGGKYSDTIRKEAMLKLLQIKKTPNLIVEAILKKLLEEKTAAFVATCLKEMKGKVQKEHFTLISDIVKNQKSPEVQEAILPILGTLAYESVLPLLKGILDEEGDAKIKEKALGIIADFKKKDCIEYLEKLAESKPALHNMAYRAIARLDSEKGIPFLAQIIKQDASLDMDALSMLVSFAPSQAKSLITTAFAKTKSDQEKLSVLNVCAPVCGVEQMDLLMDMIQSPDPDIRTNCGKLLDKIAGIESGYDPKDAETKKKAIELWKQWQTKYRDAQNLTASFLKATKEEEKQSLEKELLARQDDAIQPLSKALAEEKSVDTQIVLIQLLGKTKNAKAVPAVKTMLTSFEPRVRTEAYNNLKLLGDEIFGKDVPFLYLAENDPLARLTLLSLMSADQFAIYKDHLLQFARSSESKVVSLALKVMEQQKHPDYHSAAVQALRNSADESLLLETLNILKSDVRAEDIPAMVGILEKQKSEKVQQAVLTVLSQSKDIPADKAKDAKTILTWWQENQAKSAELVALHKTIQDFIYGIANVSSEAKRALESKKDAQKDIVAARLLQEYGQKEIAAEQKARILTLLAFYNEKKAIPLFIESLNDESPVIRRVAAQALYKTAYGGDVEAMKKNARHRDSNVRFFAVKALGETKQPALMPVLTQAVSDEDIRVREEALFWATKIGFNDREQIGELLQDKAPWVKTLAIKLASQLKMKSALEPLILALNDPFPWVREAAYQALGEISGEKIVYDPFKEAKDRDESYQKWMNWWQIYQASEETKADVEKLMEEEIDRDKVRTIIVERYTKASKEEVKQTVLTQITGFLKDRRGIIRAEMAKLVGELGQRRLTKDLAEQLTDQDIRVRQAAMESIAKLTNQKLELETPSYQAWTKDVENVKAWCKEKDEKLQKEKQETAQKYTQKIEELIASTKEDALAKSLFDLGPQAVPFLQSALNEKKGVVAASIAQALCKHKAISSIPEIFPLLADKNIHQTVRKALEEAAGESLPLNPEPKLLEQALTASITQWWQSVSKENQEKALDTIEKLLNELNDQPDKLSEIARKLADMGARMRGELEEYLADKRPTVKNGVVLALGHFNDRRSIPAMLTHLKESSDVVKESILACIHTIANKKIYEGTPKTEQEWEAAANKINEWWQTTKDTRQKEMLQLLEENKDKLKDPATREKAIDSITTRGTEICEVIPSLLRESHPELRIAALNVIQRVKDTKSAGEVIALFHDPNESVRKAAYATMTALAEKEVPSFTDVALVPEETIRTLQTWWTVRKLAVKKLEEKDILEALTSISQGKTTKEDAQKKLAGLDVATLPKYLRNNDEEIRLGAIRVTGWMGTPEQAYTLSNYLADSNLQIRQVVLEAMTAQLGKLPITFDQDAESKWAEKIKQWIPEWTKKELDALNALEIANVEKESQELGKSGRIASVQNAQSAKNLIKFLQSSSLSIREKAWAILSKVAQSHGKEFAFKPQTAAELQNDIINEIQGWLDSQQTKLQEQEKNLAQKLSDIDGKQGDMLTLEGCEKLQAVVEEMREDEENYHPTLQQKYAEFLKKKGCNLLNFDPNMDDNSRKNVLFKIDETLYEYKNKLKAAEKNAEEMAGYFEKALELKTIEKAEDIKLARRLVEALAHLNYPLRNRAIRTLTAIVGENKGFEAEAIESERQKALEAWQQWANELEKIVVEKRKVYVASIKEIADGLIQKKEIENVKALSNVKILIEALTDQEEPVRIQAIGGLLALTNGENYGYNSSAKESFAEAITKWNAWLKEQDNLLNKRKEIEEASTFLDAGGKAVSADQVAKIGLLISSLDSADLTTRKIAFESLSRYASKHAEGQVQENFKYDPAALENLRKKSKEEWSKWFDEKVKPVAYEEDKRLAQLKQYGFELGEFLQSNEDVEIAGKLVESLKDASLSIRKEACQILFRLSKNETYGYRLDKDVSEQIEAVAMWKWWHKLQGRKVQSNIATRLENLQKITGRQAKLEKPSHFDAIKPVISALEDREVKIREFAFGWLQQQSTEKFAYNPAKAAKDQREALMLVKEYFTAKQNLLILENNEKQVTNGIMTKGQIGTLKVIGNYLDDKSGDVAGKAVSIFAKLGGKNLPFQPSDLKDKRDAIKKSIEDWIKGEEKRLELIETTGTITQIKTRKDWDVAKILVQSLESEYVNVREYAIGKLNDIAGKPFAYKADDPENKRMDALAIIDAWHKKLKPIED